MDLNWNTLLETVVQWLLSSGLRLVLIIIIALVALKVGGYLARRITDPFRGTIESNKRADTLASLIRYVLVFGTLAVAVVMILGEFGIQIGPILAAAGVVGLAVGFGAQNLVQDVISGFFILLEDMIRVGDVVVIGGKGGLVEKVSLRMVILRDLAGNVHYIRNGHIDVVTNMTKEYSRYVFDIGVAYRENVDEVIEVVKEVHAKLREDEKFKDDITEDIEILGLDKFDSSAVIIKARTTTKPIKQWGVAREFNRRLKMAFDEKGIEIPFPHITLYPGQDKDGSAPPLHVMMQGAEKLQASGESRS
jgi:small conductance mechanosensitive channel